MCGRFSLYARAEMLKELFQLDFQGGPGGLAAVGAGVIMLTVLIGVLNSRGVLARPPLAILRELAD